MSSPLPMALLASNSLQDLKGAFRDTSNRSPQWAAMEHAHIALEPFCRVCGRKDGLQVHHMQPFHLRPDLELDPKNLITLCEPHHLLIGHLMDWLSINVNVVADADHILAEVKARP